MKPPLTAVALAIILAGCVAAPPTVTVTETAASVPIEQSSPGAKIFPDAYVLKNDDLPGWMRISRQDDDTQVPYNSAPLNVRLRIGEGVDPDNWNWITFHAYENPQRAWEAIQHAYRHGGCEYPDGLENQDHQNMERAGRTTYLDGRVIAVIAGFFDEEQEAVISKLQTKNPAFQRVCPDLNPVGSTTPTNPPMPSIGWAESEVDDQWDVNQAPQGVQWSSFKIRASKPGLQLSLNNDPGLAMTVTTTDDGIGDWGNIMGGDYLQFCVNGNPISDVTVVLTHTPSQQTANQYTFLHVDEPCETTG